MPDVVELRESHRLRGFKDVARVILPSIGSLLGDVAPAATAQIECDQRATVAFELFAEPLEHARIGRKAGNAQGRNARGFAEAARAQASSMEL